MSDLFQRTDAVLSADDKYRYRLMRTWGTGSMALWIMLNPSTADAMQDDPTIRRVIRFTRDMGYDGAMVGNLFALRSTDPDRIYDEQDPVGPDNDEHLIEMAIGADLIIAAWGVHGAYRDRGQEMLNILQCEEIPVHALAVTKGGYPKHPLYLRASLRPTPYPAAPQGDES